MGKTPAALRVSGRRALETLGLALGAWTFVLAGRQVLLGEWPSGLALAAALAGFAGLWAYRWPAPAEGSCLAAAALAYAGWAAAFVGLASTVALDGRRYFVLFDDAFVSLRYAWNLAHGQGLVWNPGERVEGYTNLLQTLVMAVPASVFDRSGAALAVQVTGVAAMLFTALLAYRLARCLAVPEAWTAFAAVVVCYPLSYWTLLGMETGLLAVLLLGAVLVAFSPPVRTDVRLPVLLGLAVATRPDAILPVLAVLLFRAIDAGTRRWRVVAVESAIFAVFPLGLTTFRWLYYGSVLPNTYVLKVQGLPLAYRLGEGARTALPYLAWLTPTLALAFASSRLRDRRRWLLFALWASSVASHVFVGGDAWPRWRFLCPTLPFLFVLAVAGAWRAAAAVSRPRLAWLLLCVALVSANGPFLAEATLSRYAFGITDVQQGVNTALELARICRPDATVGVFFAGAVPYYSGLRAVDFLGKTDPYVARLKPRLSLGVGHNKTHLAYSIGERKPDYVEDFGWGPDDATALRPAYENVRGLWLRRGSPHVRWNLVRR